MVLPFGLSLSPRAFVKCTEAAIVSLRDGGMCLATYIDNWRSRNCGPVLSWLVATAEASQDAGNEDTDDTYKVFNSKFKERVSTEF